MRYVKAYLVDGFTIFYLPHAGMIKQALPKKLIKQTRKVLIVVSIKRRHLSPVGFYQQTGRVTEV